MFFCSYLDKNQYKSDLLYIYYVEKRGSRDGRHVAHGGHAETTLDRVKDSDHIE